MDPLLQKNKQDPSFISMEEIHSIFSNVKEVYNYNSTLLSSFASRVENWHPHQKIADIMLEMVFLFIFSYLFIFYLF